MTISLFTFVDMYDRARATAAHLLDKGVAHADANGIEHVDLLGWRLIGNMQPLSFQLMVVINFARQWPARVAGLSEPESVPAELDVRGFKAAFADARLYLGTMTAEQFKDRDDVPITFRIVDQMEPTLPGGNWLAVFATTNIQFHLSTAYAILRARGVPLDKPDMFARGL